LVLNIPYIIQKYAVITDYCVSCYDMDKISGHDRMLLET